MRCRNDHFKNSLIRYVAREWKKLSTKICNSASYQQFRKSLLSFVKPSCFPYFSIYHLVGIKLLTRLRLDFSQLREDKSRYNFHDSLYPSCPCSLEPERTSHNLLGCHNFSSALINNLDLIGSSIFQLTDTAFANILLMAIRKLIYQRAAQFCKVLSNIFSQRNVLMKYSSKYLFYISFISTLS